MFLGKRQRTSSVPASANRRTKLTVEVAGQEFGGSARSSSPKGLGTQAEVEFDCCYRDSTAKQLECMAAESKLKVSLRKLLEP